ncbi:MAG: hypothetical protein F4X04_08520 [Holophagales bacterium]|nr:hypothetical protein [Holophagales bacterium]
MMTEPDQAASQTPGEAPPPPPGASASQRGLTARHVVSVVLALFPGLGHVYNGLYQRGIVLFLLAVTSIYLATEEGLMGMVVAFVWLFNIIDAYRQASLIEQGHGPDLGVQDAAKAPPAGQLALLGGAGLFVLGFLLLLDHTFGYDMDRVWEFWPLGLLAVGAWLMIGAYLQWRRNRPEAGSDEFGP